MTIKIEQQIDPLLLDRLFGFLWYWGVVEWKSPTLMGRYKGGFARREKVARRRAERVAGKILAGTVSYEYNPEGLPRSKPGK